MCVLSQSTGFLGITPPLYYYTPPPRSERVGEGPGPLGECPLVERHADGVVLHHGAVEVALHVAVRA